MGSTFLGSKVCPECFQEKLLVEFDLNPWNINRFKKICIACEEITLNKKKAEYVKTKCAKQKEDRKREKQKKLLEAASTVKTLRFYVRPKNKYWVVRDETNLDFFIYFVTLEQAQDYCDLLNQEEQLCKTT